MQSIKFLILLIVLSSTSVCFVVRFSDCRLYKETDKKPKSISSMNIKTVDFFVNYVNSFQYIPTATFFDLEMISKNKKYIIRKSTSNGDVQKLLNYKYKDLTLNFDVFQMKISKLDIPKTLQIGTRIRVYLKTKSSLISNDHYVRCTGNITFIAPNLFI